MAGSTLVFHRKVNGALSLGGELLPIGARELSAKVLYQFFNEIMHPQHTKHCFLDWLTCSYARSLCDMAGVPQSKLPELKEYYMTARPHTSTHCDTVLLHREDGDYITRIFNGFVVSIKDPDGLHYEPILKQFGERGGTTPDLTYYHFISHFQKYDLEVI